MKKTAASIVCAPNACAQGRSYKNMSSSIPNAKTQQAISELKAHKGKRVTGIQGLMRYLNDQG